MKNKKLTKITLLKNPHWQHCFSNNGCYPKCKQKPKTQSWQRLNKKNLNIY